MKFQDSAEYIAARRAYIRSLVKWLPKVSDQEVVDEASGMSIVLLTLAERDRGVKP